ncbi:MAG TPA: tetratricopeptide repeat protein, partial [Candidatus Hydrogenedentes bacterium]|nr:tetratricopeptide repeat protein [Candidatus Hydrogenedentota bacterium]
MHQILRGSRSGFLFTSAKVWVLACCCVTLAGAVQDTVPKTDATVTADGGGDPSVREAAMAAYDKEDYAGAVDLLKDAHALDPGDAEVAGRLGFAAKETGAYELALKALDSAVELAPDNYYYWWWLSDTQRLLGRYADALQALASMRGAVDTYFDDVLVMAEDETVRRNRLRQLAGIAESVRKVAHLERL